MVVANAEEPKGQQTEVERRDQSPKAELQYPLPRPSLVVARPAASRYRKVTPWKTKGCRHPPEAELEEWQIFALKVPDVSLM